MKTGYKVVRTYSHRLESITDPPGKVQYSPGWPIRPNPDCGPLTVFRDLVSAVKWVPYLLDFFQVWECTYEPWEEPLPGPRIDPVVCWDNRSAPIRASFLPAGTDLAREVTLTKVVPMTFGVTPWRDEYEDTNVVKGVPVFKDAFAARKAGYEETVSCALIATEFAEWGGHVVLRKQ